MEFDSLTPTVGSEIRPIFWNEGDGDRGTEDKGHGDDVKNARETDHRLIVFEEREGGSNAKHDGRHAKEDKGYARSGTRLIPYDVGIASIKGGANLRRSVDIHDILTIEVPCAAS